MSIRSCVCIYMAIFFSLEKYLSDEEDQRVCEEEQVDDVINTLKSANLPKIPPNS